MSKDVLFEIETDWNTLPGTPDWKEPGRNPVISNFQIDNQTVPSRREGVVEPVDSIEGPFEAQFTLDYAMAATNYTSIRSFVFNNGGAGFTTGTPSTATWLIGADYVTDAFGTSTVELECNACIPFGYTITISEDQNTIQESLQVGVADVTKNTSFTASSPTTITDGEEAAFHSNSLTIDAGTVKRLRQAVLEFPEIARFDRENDRIAQGAIQNEVDPTLSTTIRWYEDDHLGLTLSGDSASATSVADKLGNVSGDLTINQRDGTQITKYSFSKLTSSTLSPENIISTGDNNDFQASTTWDVNGGVSVS